jgi:hypothetical protein
MSGAAPKYFSAISASLRGKIYSRRDAEIAEGNVT